MNVCHNVICTTQLYIMVSSTSKLLECLYETWRRLDDEAAEIYRQLPRDNVRYEEVNECMAQILSMIMAFEKKMDEDLGIVRVPIVIEDSSSDDED